MKTIPVTPKKKVHITNNGKREHFKTKKILAEMKRKEREEELKVTPFKKTNPIENMKKDLKILETQTFKS